MPHSPTPHKTPNKFIPRPVPQPVPEPVEEAVEAMDFFDALFLVSQGQRITKVEWNDPSIYVFLENGRLTYHGPYRANTGANPGAVGNYPFLIYDGDLLGTDWVVLP